MPEHKYTNKLINEKSPYLLQHAHNPVDWYPWGPEAFGRAAGEDKPIFLSIGYSTCHWCHVMEKESFEDEEVARLLNRDFISIKVDREERPDIDHIYMTVCQALTGSGGWPMTIFMTADKKPFYAGTYFPKNDRMGIPGLMSILDRITHAWKNQRSSLVDSGTEIVNAIKENVTSSHYEIPAEIPSEAFSALTSHFDSAYGGFGAAPKFPSPHNLYFLLRFWYTSKEPKAAEMVAKTLDSMNAGGIYDHIGFGFSRYSTDRKWLVPHFEKMLYDNALLSIAYMETYQALKNEKYADTARQIFAYVMRDMTSPEGGFYSAEDADSEGHEGKFYVWSQEEVIRVLGEEKGRKYCSYYDITPKGNFEGLNIPNLINGPVPENDKRLIEECRQKLFEHREARVHPHKDDKILTSWNGLMIAAMSMGGRILKDKRYTAAAERAAGFIFDRLVRPDGRLLARYRDGESAYPGYAEDYSFLIWGLIELYQTTYNPYYLQKALSLSDDLVRLFWDKENGGLFLYGSDGEQLIARPKESYDGAAPSANSVAAMSFLRLARLSGRHDLEDRALQQFRAFGQSISSSPAGHSFFLSAFLFTRSAAREVILVAGEQDVGTSKMLEVIQGQFRPFTVSMLHTLDSSDSLKSVIPFIDNYRVVDGKATAYVCENFSCRTPTTDAGQLMQTMLQ
ncbi:hypothetical protein DFR58_111139 [Anaerobacterium chartisolvens]|uniref:Spermatogenesis-associated protein 20-like TRX domain-containing protein n=1 Tax=Anaerobacterium chartisolvens TaxID=1297424 RepID=A0A369B497_9FIRM|nr:thioredoxin domain-containing protein [Anaerobacterium chartisolvens]RCX16390.1 hypothetical protein DFR58_111139 [Anaerobacterium chartisolvens]